MRCSPRLEEQSERARVAGPAGRAQRAPALLVEDNVNECALLVSYLRLNSFEVDAVNDGQAALDYLATKGRPDMVLLDMRLPTRKRAGDPRNDSRRPQPSRPEGLRDDRSIGVRVWHSDRA